MGAVRPRGELVVRRARSADGSFLRDLSARVFTEFGDYEQVLGEYLVRDGVYTHIAEWQGRSVGFTMLMYYPLAPGSLIADLLAIAVEPGEQGRGVGSSLLESVLDFVANARRTVALERIRLSVADTNYRARALFERHGFRLARDSHGYYDRGQRALHMERGI